MLTFLAVLFGTILGITLFLILIALYLYNKFKNMFNLSSNDLKQMINESNESVTRPKSVSGLSDIIIPKIRRDYPNFNEEELYNKTESSLKAIFNSLENKKVSNKKELTLISNIIENDISDLESTNTSVKYDDIVFHKHAIKDYKNESGSLTIEVASSVEYYFTKTKDGKEISHSNSKVQTVYLTKFIHIYDLDVYQGSKTYLVSHCPNCGAPLKNYKDNICAYCNSGVEPINLKSWYISSYESKY